jgi:ornithine carbamoyltransferase
LLDMNLVSIKELDKNFMEEIFSRTGLLKSGKSVSKGQLSGKTLALVFEKPSSRTRVSFEVAMFQLGGYTIYLDHSDIGLGVRESVGDVGKVLSRYVDGIVLRTFAHTRVLEMAESSTVPVINGLSDRFHPCQVLSDIYTIREKRGDGKVKLAFVGDGNNVAHSWLHGAAKVGWDISVASPHGYEPKPEIVKESIKDAEKTGARIEVVNKPAQAVRDADIIYTDVWASMGEEDEKEERKKVFRDYQVNRELLKMARKNALVMHCLPAHRGEEITDDVIDGPQSIVFDQAENRLHVQKGILSLLVK